MCVCVCAKCASQCHRCKVSRKHNKADELQGQTHSDRVYGQHSSQSGSSLICFPILTSEGREAENMFNIFAGLKSHLFQSGDFD